MTTQKGSENWREKRGLEIANKKERQVTRMNSSTYRVLSQSGNGEYAVCFSEDEWHCECPDHHFRGVKCKHVWAIEFSLKMREQVRKNLVIEEVTVSNCVFCHSSNIKKFGVRKNKCGNIQRFLCADCEKTFSVNIGFEKMKHSPQAVTEILMNSTTTVYELALLFGNYTADPNYLSEMQWASQELTEAIDDLAGGNTTLAYEHLHMSWQHSWNAMLLADTTPPHVCICSEKTYAWLQTPYELGGFCGYDIAGPVEYECLKEYIWDFGDGFGDSGIRVLHNYTALGTYQVVLLGSDRSDNSNMTSRQVRVTKRIDINGDWKVDVKDLATAAKAFGTNAGPPVSLRWNPGVDIDANGKIDMKDIAKVAREFGWHYP